MPRICPGTLLPRGPLGGRGCRSRCFCYACSLFLFRSGRINSIINVLWTEPDSNRRQPACGAGTLPLSYRPICPGDLAPGRTFVYKRGNPYPIAGHLSIHALRICSFTGCIRYNLISSFLWLHLFRYTIIHDKIYG